MDPRIALSYWLDNSDKSYEAGRNYNEWTARGGFPAVIILDNGLDATVIKVSGASVKVIFNQSGKKATVKRSNINRVSLY